MNNEQEKKFYTSMQYFAESMNDSKIDHPTQEYCFKAWYTLNNNPIKSGLDIFVFCAALNLLNTLDEETKKQYNLDKYFKILYGAIEQINSPLISTYANNEERFVFIRFYDVFNFSFSFKTTSKDLVPKQYFNNPPIPFDSIRKKKIASNLFEAAIKSLPNRKAINGKSLKQVLEDEVELFKSGSYTFINGIYDKIDIKSLTPKDQINIEEYKKRLLEIKEQNLTEIPLDARPKMIDFDFDKEPYVIISYSRKDFVEVYLFLASLYNQGYRFWYDNGMLGTDKWLNEYRNKFENPNCLGTITFFSENYVSNSIKDEISIIYEDGKYKKTNAMISLIPLSNIDANEMLIKSISNHNITIENAYLFEKTLTKIIKNEKAKTTHRYEDFSSISRLTDIIAKIFNL